MKILFVTEFVDSTTPASAPKRYYVITKAVNTVLHSIGDNLSWAHIDDYCGSLDWKIIVTKGAQAPDGV